MAALSNRSGTISWLRLWMGTLALILVAMAIEGRIDQESADDGGIGRNLPGNTYYVKVRNELPGRTLTVHCKSGDKDLGIQYAPPGHDYVFKFNKNFWGTTLFWCRFVDGPRWNSFTVWPAPATFSASGHRYAPCVLCLWVARADGLWVAQDNGSQPLIISQPWRIWPPATSAVQSDHHTPPN